MQESTVQVSPRWRVLGEAACWVLIAPVLFLVVYTAFAKLFGLPSWCGFLLFTLCGTSQLIALAKLRSGNVWKFGLAKIGRYLLVVLAFLLLLFFGDGALIAGYYLLYPGAPALFGGT